MGLDRYGGDGVFVVRCMATGSVVITDESGKLW